MSDVLTREQVEQLFLLVRAETIGDTFDRVVKLEEAYATIRVQLAQLTAELKKHLSGDYSNDPVDGIRQLAQAMVSNRGNCQTLEQQLADVTADYKKMVVFYRNAIDMKNAEVDMWIAARDTLQARVTELGAALKGKVGG